MSVLKLSEHHSEAVARVLYPRLTLELLRRYLRIEMQGLEHIPEHGPVVVAPNHSGCAGLDATMLGYLLRRECHRLPMILAVWNMFRMIPPFTALAEQIGEKLGVLPACYDNGLEILKRHNILVVFPEGERGSFKPSSQAYHLQEFHTGFVRLALQTRAPLVPCLILGAEETHLNFGKITLPKFMKSLTLPLPVNLLPLPAKWTVKFFPPVPLDTYAEKDVDDLGKMQELAGSLRHNMQRSLNIELRKRDYVYFASS